MRVSTSRAKPHVAQPTRRYDNGTQAGTQAHDGRDHGRGWGQARHRLVCGPRSDFEGECGRRSHERSECEEEEEEVG